MKQPDARDMAEDTNLRALSGEASPKRRVFEPGQRLRSTDYGPGTVVAVFIDSYQIEWDYPLIGTDTRRLVHDKSYVELQVEVL